MKSLAVLLFVVVGVLVSAIEPPVDNDLDLDSLLLVPRDVLDVPATPAPQSDDDDGGEYPTMSMTGATGGGEWHPRRKWIELFEGSERDKWRNLLRGAKRAAVHNLNEQVVLALTDGDPVPYPSYPTATNGVDRLQQSEVEEITRIVEESGLPQYDDGHLPEPNTASHGFSHAVEAQAWEDLDVYLFDAFVDETVVEAQRDKRKLLSAELEYYDPIALFRGSPWSEALNQAARALLETHALLEEFVVLSYANPSYITSKYHQTVAQRRRALQDQHATQQYDFTAQAAAFARSTQGRLLRAQLADPLNAHLRIGFGITV